MINAMIFAAGLGTRLYPLTADRPKALVILDGKTLLQHAIERMICLGVDRLVINVHHYAQQIVDFLDQNDNFGLDIRVSDESDLLLDTGGGLKKAQNLFIPNSPVLIYNVDILSDMDLQEFVNNHKESGALASLAVRSRQSSRYLLFDQQRQLCGWKNVRTEEVKIARPNWESAQSFAFNGIHMVNPEIFSLIKENGPFSIIDLYLRLAQNNQVMAFNDDSQLWMDLGKPEQLKKAEQWIELHR